MNRVGLLSLEFFGDRPLAHGLALLLFALPWTGCSSPHAHSSLGFDVTGPTNAEPIRVSHDLPGPYRVLALFVTAEEPAAAPQGAEPDAESYPFSIEMIEEHLARLLEDSGGFDKVIPVGAGEGKEPAQRAREAGAGLLMHVRLEDPYLVHRGGAPGSSWAFFTWIWMGWATHWWHDQIFELHFRPHVQVTDLVSGLEVGAESLPVFSWEEALSFHERSRGAGVYFLTLVWPPAWCPAHPEAVMENLLSASGSDSGRFLGEFLSRLYLAEVTRNRKPEGKDLPVTLTFESPLDGAAATDEVALRLRLDLAGTLRDLLSVRIGDEVLWEAEGRENIPPVKGITLERKISLSSGHATISVTLRSKPEPIRAEITRRSEVRLRKLPAGS